MKTTKILIAYIITMLTYAGFCTTLLLANRKGYKHDSVSDLLLNKMGYIFPVLIAIGVILLIYIIVLRLRKEMEKALFRKYSWLLIFCILLPWMLLLLLLSGIVC